MTANGAEVVTHTEINNKQQSTPEDTSVSSRIMLFNQHVQQHMHWQQINPFSHYNVRDVPRHAVAKHDYGRAPSGSRSEQRALQAQVQSLEEVLQLCELISRMGVGAQVADDEQQAMLVSLKFGALFELYNSISDKLLGTLLRARKHNYVNFPGEMLFQGRDDAVPVHLQRPFDDLRSEILDKIEQLRSPETQKLSEKSVLGDAQSLLAEQKAVAACGNRF